MLTDSLAAMTIDEAPAPRLTARKRDEVLHRLGATPAAAQERHTEAE
jgi:hypothetical protein